MCYLSPEALSPPFRPRHDYRFGYHTAAVRYRDDTTEVIPRSARRVFVVSVRDHGLNSCFSTRDKSVYFGDAKFGVFSQRVRGRATCVGLPASAAVYVGRLRRDFIPIFFVFFSIPSSSSRPFCVSSLLTSPVFISSRRSSSSSSGVSASFEICPRAINDGRHIPMVSGWRRHAGARLARRHRTRHEPRVRVAYVMPLSRLPGRTRSGIFRSPKDTTRLRTHS